MDNETERMIKLATNPTQYDASSINWATEGDPETPWRKFFRQIFLRELGDLSGKDIVDIGSGTGHLFTLFPDAHRMLGIEPSKKNVAVSKKFYPDLEVLNASLLGAQNVGEFDIAIASMSFEHIFDLDSAFTKISSFLRSNGVLCILSYDFKYAQQPRYGRENIVQLIDAHQAVIKADHAFGALHDIVRTSEGFISAAEDRGFMLQKQVPIMPSEELMIDDPRRRAFSEVATHQLYIFKKSS